jgi:hypothetical protein
MAASSLPPGELPPNIAAANIQTAPVKSDDAELKKKLETDHKATDTVANQIEDAVVADNPILLYSKPVVEQADECSLEEDRGVYTPENVSPVVEDYTQIALSDVDGSSTFEDKLSVGEVKDFTTVWPSFLDHMLKDRPNLGSFLSIGYVASCTETTINIKFPSSNSFQFQEVTKKSNRDQIERFLFEFTGRKIELHITVETKKLDAQERQFLNNLVQAPSTINDEIENEPIIQAVLDIFDGEVLN